MAECKEEQHEAKECVIEVKKEEEIIEYTEPLSGIGYRVGDTVYIESQRSDMPYFICTIRNFNKNKKDNISVDVVWLYRPCEIPTSVYELLSQDRRMEYGSNILDDPFVRSRELFISDAVDVYPVSALRGHACCLPFSEIKDNVLEYICKENNWFYILGYNPESRRMANAKGEIRIGASHQACPPVCNTNRESTDAIDDLNSTCKEELLWKPTLPKSKLMVYLRAARSILSFSGYCESEDPEKALNALSEDQNTAHSYNVLHKNSYDISVALRELIRNPTPKKISMPWTDDDRKRFMQGLRSYGKTFHKIQKEFLPDRKTSELVTYYYIWKKTPIAINSRPHKRGGRRNNILARRTRTTKPKTADTSEFLDLSSCSEDDMEDTDTSENATDLSLYACRNCYATKSPNWHHGGKNKILLCYVCRMYFKHYGQMRIIPEEEKREPPPFIFKAAFENLDDCLQYSGRMRTRRSSTPVFTNANSIRSRLVQEGKIGNRIQVTIPSNLEMYSDKEDKEESEVEVNVLKRKGDEEEIDLLQETKKRRQSEATDAEDADDESEEDCPAVRINHVLSDDFPHTMASERSMNSEVISSTMISSSMVTASPSMVSSSSSVSVCKQENISPTPAERTFIPIKQENAEVEEVEESELEDANNIEYSEQADSSPDVSDNEKQIQKIKERFVHNETESGNSCSRCEMYYIYKRPRKQRPAELDTSKRRDEYNQRKDSSHKRNGSGTPPSTHQPAQITSHYETMRLFAAQVARSVEPKHYWPPGYQVPHEMAGHRPTSPREYHGDPSRKYVHLLDALENRPHVELRSPRSTAVPGHPSHASHNYPPRPSDNRDFRINPPNHPHIPHPPVSLDNMSRIPLPTSMDNIPLDGGPPIDRPRIDPLTGLPAIQPHLHSHHHTHTHLHVHPDDLKYNRHCAPPPPEAAHFERHERAQQLHQAPHPPQLSATSHRPNSYGRDYYEHLSKYPDLLAQMQHDPHLRESLPHHPLGGGGRGGGDARREAMLHPSRDGAISPSIPHDIPSAPSDPVAYHLWVTKYANMQHWKSHGNAGQSHAQAPELSPHGMPQPPHLPHDIRNEHEKHMKEKLLYAHSEREQMAYAEHLRTIEHEKHLRSMLHSQDHADSVKLSLDRNIPPDHHSFKRGDIHKPYQASNPFIDNLRRAHDTQVPGHERGFNDSLRFGHDRLERDRAVHQERAMHMERYPDRSRHERPSIFGNYKPPETIDLSEE